MSRKRGQITWMVTLQDANNTIQHMWTMPDKERAKNLAEAFTHILSQSGAPWTSWTADYIGAPAFTDYEWPQATPELIAEQGLTVKPGQVALEVGEITRNLMRYGFNPEGQDWAPLRVDEPTEDEMEEIRRSILGTQAPQEPSA